MSSPQHTTVAGTPTGLSAISQPPPEAAQILEVVREGSGDEEDDERAALLEKLALLDKQGQERKKAEAEKRIREEQEQMAREGAERKAREEEAKKAHEDAVQKARQEAEKKAREDSKMTVREQARSFDLQAKRKAREESEKEAYERHAILLKERERKVREAAVAVLRTSPSSIICADTSDDQDGGEGPSRKVFYHISTFSFHPLVLHPSALAQLARVLKSPAPLLTRRENKSAPLRPYYYSLHILIPSVQIEVDDIEDDSDFDSIMQKRGPCENCIRKHLRCYLQPRSGRSSACAPCNKSKHGCSWVPKKQIQPKTERKPTVAADILSDHLGTLIGQSNFIIHLLKIIADNTTEDPGWEGDAQESDILKVHKHGQC
ncbi:hypothetical protein F5890DRAFT_1479092 [Lentinula detonsa]|uniref:Uncharacterized protein n=1 Tax=Lentinula detonsa TaxID=2804962 RepID=A0AA38UP72_9AGAR|nr:hypothetical protein F5890DRAFT_1479092 [Lentinula detonsa]